MNSVSVMVMVLTMENTALQRSLSFYVQAGGGMSSLFGPLQLLLKNGGKLPAVWQLLPQLLLSPDIQVVEPEGG
jgi:hypothetical protein